MSNGCCDKTEITEGSTIVSMPGGYRYEVRVIFCKNCGSEKSTSSIRQLK